MPDLVAWLQETDRRRAERVLEVACGFAVLDDTYPSAHSLNKMVVTSVCTAQDVVDTANDTLGHLGHRLVEVHDPVLADALAPGLASCGWTRSDDLVMTSARPGQPSPAVVELALLERQRVAAADWERDEPQQDPEVWRQLGDRVQTIQRAADATYLAVRAESRVIARADLYLRGGTAQVEEVLTDPGHRGQGHASTLVHHALHLARRRGAEVVFLLAEADNWPQQLYRRLGFTDTARTSQFAR